MIALLLRLYPASWRARYGDEFELILADRPLGPFDVADVLLGALDAHLHLRGLGAASQHAKGFAMSLRIGGWAAIGGGLLWFIGLAAASLDSNDDANGVWVLLLAVGTALLLVALVGLSAFQAHRYPRAVWAAFLLPAVGSVVSIVGMLAMGLVGDRPFIAGLVPWEIWMIGLLALTGGSGLFAIVTWLTRSLSRVAAAILAAGSASTVATAFLGIGGGVSDESGQLIVAAVIGLFAVGWAGLGLSALRLDRPPRSTFEGAVP